MAEINIMLGNFKILHVSGSSTVVVGKCQTDNISSYSKTNEGVGTIYGDSAKNNMVADKAAINDCDFMDLPMVKDSFKLPK